MGVPSFYRWLSRKYPKVVLDVAEEKAVDLPSGQKGVVNSAAPNPNGFEVDNLYLDMNGIIHPCCHPEDGDAPDDEDEMIARIFLYIDRIFAMVRPRKVLYMAIDGVAPRAKMNQQRSRRFRSAKEVTDKEIAEDELRKEWQDKGMEVPPKKRRPWDSNVITPGTPFMAKLSRSLHWYIYDRLSHTAGWKNVKIIFSDAKVPGEGEHKIMKFIRRQRAAPGYDPNTRHVLYGMDADLIMLGLASHDPYFLILRETITEQNQPNRGPRCFMCGVIGHRAEECSGIQEEEKAKAEATNPTPVVEPGLFDKPFQFLQLNVLREYLAYDLYVPNLPFAWDLERCIDDFIFLAFFVGNDFLPHLPLLEIHEGAIERLIGIYKRCLPSLGGYISENGNLNLTRVDVLFNDLGLVEDSIFKTRKSKEDYQKQRDANRNSQLSARRAQTMKARESQVAAFAETQGFSAVSNGLAGKVNHPIVKTEKPLLKSEIRVDDESGPAPVYTIKKEKGTKRKSIEGGANNEEADSSAAAASSSSTPTAAAAAPSKHADKKKKLSTGKAKKLVKNNENDSELDSDDDANDPSFKPNTNADDDDEDMSSSDESSDDDEEEKTKKKAKAKAKKAKRAAKNAKNSDSSSAVAASASLKKEGVKSENEPLQVTMTELQHDSTGRITKALEAQSSKLDFGQILNAKLKAMQRPQVKKNEDGEEDPEDAEKRDPVRFGEEGWKPRYYLSKMHINRDRKEDGIIFHKLFKSYAEGLAWVMKYYYEGCVSWNWYYPFHYAPMASDLTNLDRYKIDFELSEPFKPISQLMGVLPGKSAHALPVVCQELMMNPLSPIIDFYPENFELDLNGKRALWQAVALLPWIEEKRLLNEIAKIEPQLTDEEKDRNSLGVDYLFVHKSNLLANSIYALYNAYPPESLKGKTHLECSQLKQEPIDIAESRGMNGFISPYITAGELDGSLKSEVGLHTIEDINVMSVIFTDPPHRPHVSALLPGLIPPKPLLTPTDFEEAQRGGPRQHDGNQSRHNQQRNYNQRDSNRQPQGPGAYQSHGGQAPSAQPRFGDAPSHFQQGDVSARIWSSGYNQKGPQQGGYQHQQQQRPQQQGGYQPQQQQQQQGYQQQSYQHYQQPQQGYSHAQSRPAYQQPQQQQYNNQQRAPYQHVPAGMQSFPPPPPQQPYQHSIYPQQPLPPPPPAAFSHAKRR